MSTTVENWNKNVDKSEIFGTKHYLYLQILHRYADRLDLKDTQTGVENAITGTSPTDCELQVKAKKLSRHRLVYLESKVLIFGQEGEAGEWHLRI